MKTRIFVWVFAAGLAGVLNADSQTDLSDPKAKASYAIGMNFGSQWRTQDIDVDPEIMMKGLKDSLAGQPTALTEAEMREVLTQFQRQLREKQAEKRKQLGETNRKAGQDFLAANKDKEGVKTLPSGLQYKVLAEGKGESPKNTDTVTVNYRGTLIDGTEFDSSYKSGKPATFAVTGVIKGWTEALLLMRPGDKWQLFIPSELAYGERGYGRNIGPNESLIFEVELESFGPPPLPAASTPAAQPVVTSDIIKVPSKEEFEKGAKVEILKPEDVERLQKEAREAKKDQPQN